jgi:LigXa C-terminal domain like
VRNKDNNWLIDRQAQRTQNFTGIIGVNTQDRAVQELQGRIADRTKSTSVQRTRPSSPRVKCFYRR